MNFERTLEILSKDIEEIENILAGLKKSSPPEEIELELAVSKLKNLKENFQILGRALPQKSEPIHAEKQAKILQVKQEQKDEKVPRETLVRNKQNTLLDKTEKEPEPAQVRKSLVSPNDKSGLKEKKGKKVFLSDTFQTQHAYRNEDIGKTHPGKNLSSKLKDRPITDLNRSIGLNEKFMFIRDLFHGDTAEYTKAIQFINTASSRKKVEAFVAQCDWDTSLESAQQFIELIHRKMKNLPDE